MWAWVYVWVCLRVSVSIRVCVCECVCVWVYMCECVCLSIALPARVILSSSLTRVNVPIATSSHNVQKLHIAWQWVGNSDCSNMLRKSFLYYFFPVPLVIVFSPIFFSPYLLEYNTIFLIIPSPCVYYYCCAPDHRFLSFRLVFVFQSRFGTWNI